jgi:ribA/ribD-fused uncharacterized protein
MIISFYFCYYKKMATNENEKFFENDVGIYFKSKYPSQWYIAPFIIDDKTYNCCEKYMMAEKARFFNDADAEKLIMLSDDPKEHKSLGRNVKNFDADKWNEVVDYIVYKANFAKFTQNPDLKQKLLNSGGKIYVECSPYDKIWGNGMNITETLNTPIENWKGTNRLGLAIMKVRNTLRTM